MNLEGTLLREARAKAKMTQLQAAQTYGIEERTIRRWENGEFSPKMCDVLGLIKDVYGQELTITLGG